MKEKLKTTLLNFLGRKFDIQNVDDTQRYELQLKKSNGEYETIRTFPKYNDIKKRYDWIINRKSSYFDHKKPNTEEYRIRSVSDISVFKTIVTSKPNDKKY